MLMASSMVYTVWDGEIFSRLSLVSSTRTISSFQTHRFLKNLIKYTSRRRTGTSIKGPTVDASAWLLSAPNVAIATAIASSKLLLAAVNVCTVAKVYANPRRRHMNKVMKNMIEKYAINGAATRRTRTIWFTTFCPWEAKRMIIVNMRPISDRGEIHLMKWRW